MQAILIDLRGCVACRHSFDGLQSAADFEAALRKRVPELPESLLVPMAASLVASLQQLCMPLVAERCMLASRPCCCTAVFGCILCCLSQGADCWHLGHAAAQPCLAPSHRSWAMRTHHGNDLPAGLATERQWCNRAHQHNGWAPAGHAGRLLPCRAAQHGPGLSVRPGRCPAAVPGVLGRRRTCCCSCIC